MYVILCAGYWVLYTSLPMAQFAHDSSTATVNAYGCSDPQEVTPQQVEYYKSKEYSPELLSSLDHIGEMERIKQENAIKTAQSDKPAGEEAPRQAPGKAPIEIKPDGDAAKCQPAAPTVGEKHCKYSFVRTGPHTLRMLLLGCWYK